jgi:uncharacterized damage-inducible protein DinB
MRRRIWFERSFELGMPPEAQPELIERLRGTPFRLEERVGSVAPERLVIRPGGGWSISEHAGHLSDLEPLWAGRVDDLLAGRVALRPADLRNAATWEADHNRRTIQEIVGEFRERRGQLIRTIEALPDEKLLVTALHPRLKQPMSLVDLCFFVAEHDDHHLATITALRADPFAIS